jgi:hypothetical protein
MGFAITYKRVADRVWFPATYGTEFQINALFFYKRTINHEPGKQRVSEDRRRINDPV